MINGHGAIEEHKGGDQSDHNEGVVVGLDQ